MQTSKTTIFVMALLTIFSTACKESSPTATLQREHDTCLILDGEKQTAEYSKILSARRLGELEDESRRQGKSMGDLIAARLPYVAGDLETRGESIDGSRATVYVRYPGTTPEWKPRHLIKEDGAWKIDDVYPK